MKRAFAVILLIAAGVALCAYWRGEQQAQMLPLVHASAADDSRLYALCPTIVPWQAPKYVKEHKA